MDRQRKWRQMSNSGSIRVENGIVYDAYDAELLHWVRLSAGIINLILAVTPDGHFVRFERVRGSSSSLKSRSLHSADARPSTGLWPIALRTKSLRNWE